MYPNNYWSFGGFGGGGFGTGLPGLGGGPSYGGAVAPWWVDAGIYLGNQTGFFDWIGESVFGQDGGDGGGGYVPTQYPTSVGGMPINYVSQFLNPLLVPGTGDNRQRVLQSYQDNPDIISRFLDWLQTIGAIGSLLSQMASSTIFEWPIILQDLILLFYHDEAQAVEIGPQVVHEANTNTGSLLPPGGGFSGALSQFAPPVLPVQVVPSIKPIKGYVVVTDPQSGQKAMMKKEVARALKLYKPRRKAPITGREWDAIKKAKRYEVKLSKMLIGIVTGKRQRTP